MEVLRINLNRLRNEEWFGLLSEFKVLAPQYSTDKLGLSQLYERFLELHNRADITLVVLRKSVYTKELEALDKTRTDAVRGFVNVITGYLKYPSAEMQRAAAQLDILTDGYKKDILKGSNLGENAAMGNLIDDLATPQYTAALKTLNLNNWFTALATAELDYQSALQGRFEESSGKPKEDLRKLRAKLGKIYSAAVHTLETQLILKGLDGDIVVNPDSLDGMKPETGESFDPKKHGDLVYNFVQAWNEHVKKARDVLSRREGESGDEENEADEDDDTEELPLES
jgi:hypothetical protein